ncbi:MAG: GGDEF domain-containing response regulator [Candidatus Bipolaricaulia bacterium]
MSSRILLIEDNPDYVRLVEETLKRGELPCSVTCVSRVADSVPMLDAGEADLILLDLGLPDSVGLEGFHRVRAQAPDIPIVILTGLDDIDRAREALLDGAQDYLIKDQLEGNFLIHAVRFAAERHALQQELQELALRDPLTGLYNRRGFRLLADQSLRLAKRNARESVLLMADVDKLKAINDVHGHPTGDQALCAVARAFTSAMRDSDIVARLSGDEFVALAVEASPPGVPSLVSRLREMLAEEGASFKRSLTLSVSIGIAPFDPKAAPTLDHLIEAADRDMYREKAAGKHPEQVRLSDVVEGA